MNKKDKKIESIWLSKPEAKDYRAACEYLKLLFPSRQAEMLVKRLRKGRITEHQAKDLLRASQTHLLGDTNPHVVEQLKKVRKGKKISPVLLIRGDAPRGVTLTIADGHHRVCASWYWDEDAPIACAMVELPPGRN
jgi:hypothetical protein